MQANGFCVRDAEALHAVDHDETSLHNLELLMTMSWRGNLRLYVSWACDLSFPDLVQTIASQPLPPVTKPLLADVLRLVVWLWSLKCHVLIERSLDLAG